VNSDDRELRLRQRIDELTDQRDHARARAALVPRLRNKIYALTKSRDTWRHRWRTK
jgi:hypothetical protein